MVLVCVGTCMFYHIIIKQVEFGRDFSRSSRPTLMILFLCPDENHNLGVFLSKSKGGDGRVFSVHTT